MANILLLTRKELRQYVSVFAGALLIWGYCAVSIDPAIGFPGLIGMSFQIFAFAAGWVMLIRRGPSGRLTFGNPGFIFALVCISYLMVPSILWLTGSSIRIPYGDFITPEIGSLLLWLHGLYFLAFVTAYTVSSLPISKLKMLGRNQLPSGRWFSIGVFVVLISIGLGQVLSTGQLLPQQGRDASVLVDYEAYLGAVQSGGLSLIYYQILNRIYGFAILFTGLWVGLIYAKNAHRKLLSLLRFITLFLLAGFIVILTGGGRGPVVIAALIGLVLVDYLCGPLKWRYLAVILVIGLIGSEFLAYARNQSADTFFSLSDWFSYWKGTEDKFFEQTVMFGKEAVAVSVTNSTGETWGPVYLIQALLKVIPQQIIPFKVGFPSVGGLLSETLLSPDAVGSGLAGTAIGEGYFLGRALGVAVIGGVSGLILGLIQRWLMRRSNARLWHLIPLAYLASNLLFVVRSDLSALLNNIVLGVLPLWFFLRLLFGRLGCNSLWNQKLFASCSSGDLKGCCRKAR